MILSWWTVLYIVVPVSWVNFQAHSYTFGVSVGALPYENEVYAGTVPIALVCLTFMWLSLVVGILVRLRFVKPVRLGFKLPRFTFLGVMLPSLVVFPWLVVRLW